MPQVSQAISAMTEALPPGRVTAETFRTWVRAFADFHGMSEQEMLVAILSVAPEGTFYSLRSEPPTPEAAAAWSASINAIPEELLVAAGMNPMSRTGGAISAGEVRDRLRRMMASAQGAADVRGPGGVGARAVQGSPASSHRSSGAQYDAQSVRSRFTAEELAAIDSAADAALSRARADLTTHRHSTQQERLAHGLSWVVVLAVVAIVLVIGYLIISILISFFLG
jgi:hypothetical protein